MSDRRQESYEIRLKAAELARCQEYPEQQANDDEQKYAGDNKYFMSFTKGLPHEEETGLLHDPQDFVELRRAIDDGFINRFSDKVRHGSGIKVENGVEEICKKPDNFRQWEAPTAGFVFDLEGPDALAVTMPPAPPLTNANGQANPELALEMAEVYELAFLRDKPFNFFEENAKDKDIDASINRLNGLDYIRNQTGRPRKVASNGKLDLQTVFRGSSPGVEVGPYLSQFMLLGNTDFNDSGSVTDGKITYGVLQIDQRVPIAEPKDFMTTMEKYVEVQRGLKPNPEIYEKDCTGSLQRRFITTPRDLATYVHYDALYEAYLNACLILLGMETPFDPDFDNLSGGGVSSENGKTRRNASGFALYGGPHILTLVTEVATRALKAVRYQKFNNHIRLRPEALAARIELIREPAGKDIPSALSRDVTLLKEAIAKGQVKGESVLDAIANKEGNNGTYFLPMAFPEGSPMHPAYGAGHATVAGACVTILKAFFDTNAVLVGDINNPDDAKFKRYETSDKDKKIAFRAPSLPQKSDSNSAQTNENQKPDDKLVPCKSDEFLTLEGELNKLAANISIGRNMAGVHFFTDYYDSLRMGEEIAIGLLQEQALTYPKDPFVMTLRTFDDKDITISR